MSQLAFDRYVHEMNPETTEVFVDETLVVNMPDNLKYVYRIPATKLAEEKCDNRMVANTIMLTVMVKMTNVVSIDALRCAITEQFDPKMRDLNINTLEMALDYCKEQGINK